MIRDGDVVVRRRLCSELRGRQGGVARDPDGAVLIVVVVAGVIWRLNTSARLRCPATAASRGNGKCSRWWRWRGRTRRRRSWRVTRALVAEVTVREHFHCANFILCGSTAVHQGNVDAPERVD